MSDVSKTSERSESSQLGPAGSSKLELPTTIRPGSSLTKAAPPASHTGESSAEAVLPLTEQPTAISQQPVFDDTGRNTIRSQVKTLVGKRLQHFELDEYVGGGGMGAVFRGRDTSLGRTVAVKVLSRDSIDDETVKRFHHEARSAAKLDHPRIPRVYFVGEDESWHFIAFEFVEGDNIRDLVQQQGKLPIAEAVAYLADIAEALQHASSRDVVHRDVKPSNVLVNDGRATLVDMGLARTNQIQSATGDLTATGVTLGTFDYISPEQARDPRDADTRSDIYSLGCTLYFMLTGRPPFPEGTMLQKLLSHTSEAPRHTSEFRSDISPRLNALLARMLAKKPEHRHQDATDLLGDILMLAEDENIQLNKDRGTGFVIERKIVQETGIFRHIPWLVPLIVLVGAAAALQYWPGEPSTPPDMSGTVQDAGESSNEPEAALAPTGEEVLNPTDDAPLMELMTTGDVSIEESPSPLLPSRSIPE